MPRNKYDGDVSTWSPEGRIYQLEYAMEAMNQGNVVVGIKSKEHAVLAAVKKTHNDLSEHQEKILKLGGHVGLAIAGLESDGRVLARYLQQATADWKVTYDSRCPIKVLNQKLLEKLQPTTQMFNQRPYGAGLVIASYDAQGSHIVQVTPNAQVTNAYAAAIGNRAQSARTYLEEHIENFPAASRKELVNHAVKALRLTLAEGERLDQENTSIAVVSQRKFKLLEADKVRQYIEPDGDAQMEA